jgi:dTDP-4-dehydrorhamnose reductase
LAKATVLLLGASGLVGTCARQRWSREVKVEAPTHAELDLLDDKALVLYLQRTRAESVVNMAAWADVDGAERERGDTDGHVYRLNVSYPRRLAELCGESGKYLIQVSTDYVFDGANDQRPYAEGDSTGPLCWYAETKYLGEQSVLRSGANVCIARIEMPFTGRDHPKRDLSRTLVARLKAGQPVQGVVDQRITPVFLDDAADALRRLVEAPYTGIIHLAAASWTTPYEFAASIAGRLGLNRELVEPVAFEQFAATRPARRPQHPWLDVSLFGRLFGDGVLRPVDEALDAWAGQLSAQAPRS